MNNEKINEDINYRKNKRNITIILMITLLLLIGIILIEPIQRHFAKINLAKEITTEVLKDIEYNNYEIEGEYFNNLNIQIKDDFENYDYSKKKEITTEVLNRFTNIFNNYKKILIGENSNNTEKKEDKVKVILICKENKYTIDKEFIKNGKNYTEEESLKEDVIKQLDSSDVENNDEIVKILQSTQYSKETLQDILNIQDIKEKSNEIIYRTALINKDSYKKELELLEKIPEYKDSKELASEINKIHELDGEWYGNGYRWIINGKVCYNVYSNYSYRYTYEQYSCKYENNVLYVFNNEIQMENLDNAIFKMERDGEKLTYSSLSYSQKKITLSKESDNIKPKDKVTRLEPSIGMTKTEVENSTWGKPEKINRTKTSYGTHEQWCYSTYKYIYFEDGIVTSIQD